MSPIGIFDSGYGGLTILQKLQERLPQHDYLYLGDNARAPYGSRSFDVVYEFTRQAVLKLFDLGCNLVILGCNTASAKALRTIQQNDLIAYNRAHPSPDGTEGKRRVLGVIRPTVEQVGSITKTRHIGYVATEGTVRSNSYELEIAKFFPDIKVTGQACPLWAAIVEAGEADSEGADFFVKKRITQLLAKDSLIDTILLGCTHYPLLIGSLRKAVPEHIRIIPQGDIIVESLADYFRRHPDMDARCSKGGTTAYLTTENPERFRECARIFLHHTIEVEHVDLV
ncbi:glutamate racemase [Prevotella sp. PINT]|jgi:Glutamate racemase|uniref:glutamate racemase n=1 Tax=Palleniella intestinalis TaxID=2736291 RepID=UPI00155182F8|nr:aspartate/glutamate racemase family protein [Palleniella intestinalis]NPD81891.1 glutamate racemase [Palleniella intestinalis]